MTVYYKSVGVFIVRFTVVCVEIGSPFNPNAQTFAFAITRYSVRYVAWTAPLTSRRAMPDAGIRRSGISTAAAIK